MSHRTPTIAVRPPTCASLLCLALASHRIASHRIALFSCVPHSASPLLSFPSVCCRPPHHRHHHHFAQFRSAQSPRTTQHSGPSLPTLHQFISRVSCPLLQRPR